MNWAGRLKRVFGIEIEQCARCGGRTGMGLEPVDLGPLRFANTLEEMLVIRANARSHGAAYNYHLRPEPTGAPAR